MMAVSWKWIWRIHLFTILMVLSLTIGVGVPFFYDWSGADQSRSPAIVGQVALGMFLATIAGWLILPFVRFDQPQESVQQDKRFQFSILTVIAGMTLVAVVLALAASAYASVLGVISSATALIVWLAVVVRLPSKRWQAISLGATMYFPYLWVLSWGTYPQIQWELLSQLAALPAFLSVLLIGSLLQKHPETIMWGGALMASIEMLVGLWCIHLGIRRSIAFQLLALLLSSYGSFVLNALVRM